MAKNIQKGIHRRAYSKGNTLIDLENAIFVKT